MIGVVLVALFAASSAPSLAEPDFQTVNVAPDVAKFCQEHLATELSARGVRVVTAREIQSMLGMERQKQLLGCADNSQSCMAELANALGTDGILLGDLGKLGSRYQLNIKILASLDGKLLATYRTAINSEDELIPELTKAAGVLAEEVLRKFAAASPAQTTAQSQAEAPVVTRREVEAPRDRHWPLIPTVVAGGLLLTGGVLHALAFDTAERLRNPARPQLTEGTAVRSSGETLQTLAFISYGLAGASVLASAALYLRGEPMSVSAWVTPNGSGVVFSGVLP